MGANLVEIFRKKNVATRVVFPMYDSASPHNLKTGETVTIADVIDSDNDAAFSAGAIAGSVVEVGTTALYQLALTAAEVNHEIIAFTLTSAGSRDQVVVIRTRGKDLNDIVNKAHATPVFDETADSLKFIAFLEQNGVIVTAGLTSATIEVFDDTHTSLFSINSSSETNGVFIISKSSPGLIKNRVYYFTVQIVTTGGTFTSAEGMITIE